MKIKLASDIEQDSIVDGDGIRTVIWTQGCPHKCKGCHNPTTHSFKDGEVVEVDDVIERIRSLENQDGITFSGGEPFCQAHECSVIAKFCKDINLNVWCYTGYTYEELLEMSEKNKYIKEFLNNIDVLIDGKFILELKSYDTKYRGSKNQRLIDVYSSLKENKVVLYDEVKNITKEDRHIYI